MPLDVELTCVRTSISEMRKTIKSTKMESISFATTDQGEVAMHGITIQSRTHSYYCMYIIIIL